MRSQGEHEVVGLLTTMNAEADRVAMHGVRREIVEAQARAAGLPLHIIDLPWPCPNDAYEQLMAEFVARQVADGIEAMAFGDLFLEDIRNYRELKLAGSGLTPLFPIWGRSTDLLAEDMIGAGLKARIAVVDRSKLAASLAGQAWDRAMLNALPSSIDPCGENGEFHTCVTDGPMFESVINLAVGAIDERDGFAFADLRLASV